MKRFTQFVIERDEFQSNYQAMQQAAMKLLSKFGNEVKSLINHLVHSGEVDGDPEFKRSLRELVKAITETPEKTEELPNDKHDGMDMDNVVSMPAADRAGGLPDGGGD